MDRYPFSLERGSKKYACPRCEKKTFVRYVRIDTGAHLNDIVGRCDREVNCQYHFKPKEYYGNNRPFLEPLHLTKSRKNAGLPSKTVCIPHSYVERSLEYSDTSNLVKYFHYQFSLSVAQRLIEEFQIGSLPEYPGSTVFWQMDVTGRTRRGKVMQYDAVSGKRMDLVKGFPMLHVHNQIMLQEAVRKGYFESPYVKGQADRLQKLAEEGKIKNFKNQSCLFGEHQLISDQDNKAVAIVESEKTAIVMTAIAPQCLWMATGSLGGLSYPMVVALKRRRIILYPDLGGYARWKLKMHSIRGMGFAITISDLLERNATPEARQKGLDIADYFLESSIPHYDQ